MSFLVYVVSMVGETNRAPFDMAEAEGELVGGFNTEYTSMRFGLFFLGEYINVINVSAISTTLFLGGWRAPWPLSLWAGANSGWWTLVWFLIKVVLVMFFFVWIRGTLPRIRYDQFMALGWKVLVPVSLVWIVLVGTARVLNNATDLSTRQVLLWMGIPVLILLAVAFFWPERRTADVDDDYDDDDVVESSGLRVGTGAIEVIRPAVTAYPIPPLDLVVPSSVGAGRHAVSPGSSASAGRTGSTVSTGSTGSTGSTERKS